MSTTTLLVILILFGGFGGIGWYGGWYGGQNPPAGTVNAGPGPGPGWGLAGGGIIQLLITLIVIGFLLRVLHVGF